MLGFSWGAWVMARTRNEGVHKDGRQVSQDCSLHLPSASDGLLKASSTSSRGQQKTRETCSSGYLLVVTHLATNPPVRCLTRAEQMGSLAFKGLCSYVENKLILALRIVSGVCLRPPSDCPQSSEGRCHSSRKDPIEFTSSLRSQPSLASNQSIAESFAESIAGLPFACSVGYRPLHDNRHPYS